MRHIHDAEFQYASLDDELKFIITILCLNAVSELM